MKKLEIFVKKSRVYDMVESDFVNTSSGYTGSYTDYYYGLDWLGNKALVLGPGVAPSGSISIYPKNLKNEEYIVNFNVNLQVQEQASIRVISNIGNSAETFWYDYSESGTFSHEYNKTFFAEDDGSTSWFGYVFQPYNDSGITSSISKMSFTDKFYTKLDIKGDAEIKITKTLKDIREPDKNNGAYSKTFLLPVSSVNDKYFEFFSHDDLSFKGDIKHACYISSEGINNLYGELILDKVISDETGAKWYSCIFIGENKTLFNLLKKDKLFEVSPTTYANLDMATIYNTFTGYSNGVEAYTAGQPLTYGIFERGEDIYPRMSGLSCITQGSYMQSYSGLTADSFTPGFWVWWLFKQCHAKYGFSVSGEFLTDPYFLNMVMPITRKNWWENPDYINIADYTISSWEPSLEYSDTISAGVSTVFTGSTLYTSFEPNDRFYNTDSGYCYYNNYELTTVRQKLEFVNNYTITASSVTNPWEVDFRFKFYVWQQYGTFLDGLKEKVYIGTSPAITCTTANPTSSGSYTFVTDYIMFAYNLYPSGITHFSVEIDTIPIGAADINFTAELSSTTNTYSEDTGGTFLRVDRFMGSQIGTFSYPQDITNESLVLDVMNMFNLVAEVDEVNKTATYTYWKHFSNSATTQDFTSNIIYDKTIEKSFSNYITPDVYSFKFKLDSDDYLTNIGNPVNSQADLSLSFVENKDQPTSVVQINSNFLYEQEYSRLDNPNFKFKMIDNTLKDGTGNLMTGDEAINYNFSKNYYCYYQPKAISTTLGTDIDWWEIDLSAVYPSLILPVYKNMFDGTLFIETSGITLSFSNVSTTGTTSYLYPTLYSTYWQEIIELINSPTTYILTAYFYISVLEFYDLKLSQKIKIGNSLFLINKVSDWSPDNPTKMELIKISNIDLDGSTIPIGGGVPGGGGEVIPDDTTPVEGPGSGFSTA